MTKLNIEQSNAGTFHATSELATESFKSAFGILSKAFSQRLQIERDAQGGTFDANAFWHDNELAEEIIASAIKQPRMKVENNVSVPMLRKGKPVFSTSRMNVRVVASAASIIRRGVRSLKALTALNRKSKSLEDAVRQADRLGGVLRMVTRLAQVGLVANNASANDAKNAAIAAFSQPGEATIGNARRALIGTLSGIGSVQTLGMEKIDVTFCTSVQVDQVRAAMTAWFESKAATKVAPASLTYNEIFGQVVPMKETVKKIRARKAKTVTAPVVAETVTETPETIAV